MSKKIRLPIWCFFAVMIFTLACSTSQIKKAHFGVKETYLLKKGDVVVKPSQNLVVFQNQSVAFLGTTILTNRIVKNSSLYHFFSTVYKSSIKKVVEKAHRSKETTNFKIINKNNRSFKVFETKNKQVLVFYKEPGFETKICINTLAKSQSKANSFFRNIDKWFARISKQ